MPRYLQSSNVGQEFVRDFVAILMSRARRRAGSKGPCIDGTQMCKPRCNVQPSVSVDAEVLRVNTLHTVQAPQAKFPWHIPWLHIGSVPTLGLTIIVELRLLLSTVSLALLSSGRAVASVGSAEADVATALTKLGLRYQGPTSWLSGSAPALDELPNSKDLTRLGQGEHSHCQLSRL
jgi:hypothetical protein